MASRSAAAPVVLRIVSDPAYLCVARAAAERFCLLSGFDELSAQRIGLALDEALANVINHGYSGRPNQPIHIEFQVRDRPARAAGKHDPGPAGEGGPPDSGPAGGRELCICVRDYGRQVTAEQIVPRPLEEVRPGGLGVHIMRSVMDRIEYRKRGVTGMELKMHKRLGP